MCGIGGIYNLNFSNINIGLLNRMTKRVRHRGPDDEGFLLINTATQQIKHCHGTDTIEQIKKQTPDLFSNFSANLGLGARRLAIMDVTERGHQPMCNDDGSIWIVYNGEVYNHVELRDELKKLGYQFTTGTDTEVVLKSYQEWGEHCLSKFNGMWAFAIWDHHKQKLFCAKDRYGVKPFYYHYDGNRFIFASEIKQILLHEIHPSINERMIYRSFKLNSFLVYADETFFNEIKILPHSHYLIIENGSLMIRRYYDLDPAAFEKSNVSFQEAAEKYRTLLVDAVKLRLRSDVEVGSCLSGGLDSSAVVSTAMKFMDREFKTFTCYYNEHPRFDERKWVDLLAKKMFIKPYFVSPKPQELLNDLPQMTWMSDYPVTSSSEFSQYHVMKLARQQGVIVMLDGQGSDEITAGYNHAFYRYYADMLKNLKFNNFIQEFPVYLKRSNKGSPLSKTAKLILTLFLKESALYKHEARWNLQNPIARNFKHEELFSQIIDLKTSKLSNFLYNLVMATSIQTLLHFEDRNSMACSIESRVPFLDHRLVEFTFTLPSSFKIKENWGKRIHRESLRQIVPSEIMDRTDKVNFAAPGESFWLRKELRSHIEEMLHSADFQNRDFYHHRRVRKLFDRYLKGDVQLGNLIWKIMALEQWFELFVDSPVNSVSTV